MTRSTILSHDGTLTDYLLSTIRMHDISLEFPVYSGGIDNSFLYINCCRNTIMMKIISGLRAGGMIPGLRYYVAFETSPTSLLRIPERFPALRYLQDALL